MKEIGWYRIEISPMTKGPIRAVAVHVVADSQEEAWEITVNSLPKLLESDIYTSNIRLITGYQQEEKK